ncbi:MULTISPECIES: hypothetical protein [Sinirhodobacter]|uniref:Uncharacterized protein n=2 Tax=Paenirhodobacter TaxID=1470577 RepID=A0A443LWQ1_9RHOB|nr:MULTISPECIES: hypothetical protein [Sinirhodobacter]RWR47010.1 hypothetical protein EOW65_12610 [Sinirhodobacter ferrireducens]RWR53645.1 hypothetical protein EOW66_03180 [Sinirhodobacter huangdaonensis]
MTEKIESYLKKHTEALVKDIGIEAATQVSGKSKATLGRYYSTDPDHSDRFMPIDVVARIEAVAKFPHVTQALAELGGLELSFDERRRNLSEGGVSSDVVVLSQRFAMLMAEYHASIMDGKITATEARRLLAETQALQKVLIEMKLHLEDETVR